MVLWWSLHKVLPIYCDITWECPLKWSCGVSFFFCLIVCTSNNRQAGDHWSNNCNAEGNAGDLCHGRLTKSAFTTEKEILTLALWHTPLARFRCSSESSMSYGSLWCWNVHLQWGCCQWYTLYENLYIFRVTVCIRKPTKHKNLCYCVCKPQHLVHEWQMSCWWLFQCMSTSSHLVVHYHFLSHYFLCL